MAYSTTRRWASACECAYDIVNGSVPRNTSDNARVGFAKAPLCFGNGEKMIDACFFAKTSDDWVILAFRITLPPFAGDF